MLRTIFLLGLWIFYNLVTKITLNILNAQINNDKKN